MITLKALFDLVMSPELNPLRTLPKIVRFQVMVVLAYLWSVVFSLYIGVTALLGPSILAHTILLIGVFFTHEIFRRAQGDRFAPLTRSILRRSSSATA